MHSKRPAQVGRRSQGAHAIGSRRTVDPSKATVYGRAEPISAMVGVRWAMDQWVKPVSTPMVNRA